MNNDFNLEELDFVEKPTKKPDKKTFGQLQEWENGFKQFVPSVKGCGPKKEVVRTSGRCKLVKNEGEKESSFSILANQPATNENFASDLLDDVLTVLKPYQKKEVKVPTAKFLHDGKELKLWVSRERKALCVHVEIDMSLDTRLIATRWSGINLIIECVLEIIMKVMEDRRQLKETLKEDAWLAQAVRDAHPKMSDTDIVKELC